MRRIVSAGKAKNDTTTPAVLPAFRYEKRIAVSAALA